MATITSTFRTSNIDGSFTELLQEMEQLFAIALEGCVLVEALDVLLVLLPVVARGLSYEQAFAILKPEGVDVFVVLPEVLSSAQIEYDLVDVLFVRRLVHFSVMAAQSARKTP